MISGFGKQGNLQGVKEWFARMQAAGVRPDITAYNSVMHGYLTAGKHAMVKELFNKVLASPLRPDAVTFGIYLNCLDKEGDAEGLKGVIALMKTHNVAPDTAIFNQLMKSLEAQHDDSGVLDVFKQLQSYNLKPDAFTYLTIFQLLGRRGNIAAIEEMYRQMKKAGVRPNKYVFNVIFSACAKRGAIDTMMTFFKRHRRPDTMSYNSILKALAECEPPELDRMSAFVRRMKIDSIYPNTETHNLLLKACANAGDTQVSLIFKQALNNTHLFPWFFAQTQASHALLSQDLLFHFSELKDDPRCSPDSQSYNILLAHLSEEGNTEHLLLFADDMKASGVQVPLVFQPV